MSYYTVGLVTLKVSRIVLTPCGQTAQRPDRRSGEPETWGQRDSGNISPLDGFRIRTWDALSLQPLVGHSRNWTRC